MELRSVILEPNTELKVIFDDDSEVKYTNNDLQSPSCADFDFLGKTPAEYTYNKMK